jgi:hypothetical protein
VVARRNAIFAALAAAAFLVAPSVSPADTRAPLVEGPIPGEVPGDPASPLLSETYPFFSTWNDLAGNGYVEQEFYLSGVADAYSTSGTKLASDVPYRTRMIVRRPASQSSFNGTVLVEWQNVTAGYDLDALWNRRHMREGYAWVGISAQRVGVNQLRGWSPTRYGSLDVTGNGAFATDQLSYDIFAQAAQALRSPGAVDPLGGLEFERVLAIGASQSAGRMTTYYNVVLPQEQPVFDGYAIIVGSAPTRVGTEPIIQVLSETDVTNPATRRPDSEVFRRWEVAGAAHSGWEGQEYRRPLSIRDLGAAPVYECTNPPFSRVWLSQPIEAAYEHLARWVDGGAPPPARAVLGVRRHDEGAQRARTRGGRHPAVAGRRANRAQHGLELGPIVLLPLRDPRSVQRRAAGRALSQPRRVRQCPDADRLGQRPVRVPPARGRPGEPRGGRPLERRQLARRGGETAALRLISCS